ncbi:MAG TPA: helix-turn-helix transcriptional regulator [Solirubrobacterales bacterium]
MDGRIGDELRQEREARGVGLEEIEAATGIRARFLLAIEEEEWDELPGEFYARAFTRKYAGYLGLDPAEFALERRPDAVGPGGAPRVEPQLVPEQPSARMPRRWLPALAAAAGLLLVAVAVVVVVASSGGGSANSPSVQDGKGGGGKQHHKPKPPPPQKTSLRLTATAEVWVCLLDGAGKPLINGEILQPGSEAGPFSSRRYSMSLGNGGVALTVDGAAMATPESSSPVGFAIDEGGKLSEIPEGERPECA